MSNPYRRPTETIVTDLTNSKTVKNCFRHLPVNNTFFQRVTNMNEELKDAVEESAEIEESTEKSHDEAEASEEEESDSDSGSEYEEDEPEDSDSEDSEEEAIAA